ncbi:GntR family transcriptional regulator [Pusillimonas sp. ANT_WB101]|uniref:GntR family transcriptional regulator n=1 Tax=Pusillimonas sp. ANT_WB101 TaxID=2597356 RepID=UPI0011EE98BF|nr:GntR family transcriptional regulator [Pusillimonas sp. ANT_WB101]KAA0890904.1 GntR family transcriptional regulator [Pusillimonas sp. ANT_WB101]
MTPQSRLSPVVLDIVESLESDIIFGVLRPNEELIEGDLMGRFGSKRHVVRAAIQELVTRRVSIKPRGRSARVIDFTPIEVAEIYHMRELLQREAAHIMPMPVDESALNSLKEIHVRYVAAVSVAADRKLIHKLNDEFHESLFSLCVNKELCKAIAHYTEASNPIRSYGIAVKNWLHQATEEHAAMIRAIEEQDRATLKQLVVDHMQPTRRRWEALHTGMSLHE